MEGKGGFLAQMQAVAAAKVQQRETEGLDLGFLSSKARERALDAVQLEDVQRQPWLDTVAENLEAAGGWAINFSAAEEECSAVQLKKVFKVEPRQNVWRIVDPEESEAKEEENKIHPVIILDNAMPASWCETFIQRHEQVGFTPQREVTLMNPHFEGYSERTEAHDEYLRLNSSEVVAVSSQPLADVLWRRVKDHCPQEVEVRSDSFDPSYGQGGKYRPVGIVPEFRFLRFKRGQRWFPHIDQMKLIRVNPLRPGRRSSPKKSSVREDSRSYQSLVTIAVFLNEPPSEDSTGVEEDADVCADYLSGVYSSFKFKKAGSSFNPLLSGGAAGFALRFVRKFAHSSIASEVGHGSFRCVASVTPAPGRCAIFLHKELHEYSFSEDALLEEQREKEDNEKKKEKRLGEEGKQKQEGKQADGRQAEEEEEEEEEEDGEVPCFAADDGEDEMGGDEDESAAKNYLVLCDVLYERFAPWEEHD
jgi:hypothetical protein